MKSIVFVAVACALCSASPVHFRQSLMLEREKLSSPAEIEKSLLKIAHSAGRRATPGLSQFVDLIDPMLKEMEGKIKTAQNSTQNTIDTFMENFGACSKQQSNGHDEEKALLRTRSSRSSQHKSCRTEEGERKTTYDSCASDLHTLDSSKKAACDAYHSAVKVPNVNLVPHPQDDEKYRPWLIRVRDWAIQELESVDGKKESCDNATSSSNEKRVECEGADGNGGLKKNYTDQKKACDEAQVKLEAAACAYAEKVKGVCDVFDNCYNNSLTLWLKQRPNLEVHETSIKNEWWMVQRIKCYLGVFGEADGGNIDSSKIDMCKKQQYEDGFLSLTWPTIPSAPGACPSPPKPCTDEYLASEYNNLPENAPSNQCNECVAPSKWTLVFRQTLPTLFTPGEYTKNAGAPESDNYANLNKLEQFRRDGFLEFKLQYPPPWSGVSLKEPQQWKQTSNPTTFTVGYAEGYEALKDPPIAYTQNNWGGLAYDNNNCLLKGSVSSAKFYYCIGLMKEWRNPKTPSLASIPGPFAASGQKIEKVELYVRSGN